MPSEFYSDVGGVVLSGKSHVRRHGGYVGNILGLTCTCFAFPEWRRNYWSIYMDESFPPQCLREYRSFVSWWFTLPGSPRGRCPNQNNIVLIKSRRQAADVKHTQASLTVWVLPLPSIGICKSNLIRSWKDFERRYWGVFLSFRCRCLHLLVWLRKESR